MAMPKAPINITLDTGLPVTVSGIDGEGREFTARPLTSIPATWLRRVAASVNVPAGKGTSNQAMIDGIVAIFDPAHVPAPVQSTSQSTTSQSTTTTTTKEPAVPTTTTTNQSTDDLATVLRNAIGIDEARVLELIAEHAPQGASRTIVIERPAMPSVQIDGAHKMFELVLKRLVNQPVSGRYPYLIGPAGSGKSTIGYQCATALGVSFTSQSMTCVPQDHILSGYMDANGQYVESAMYRTAKDGGLCLFDEMDAAYPSTLVMLNDALASRRFTFPNGETVHFHPDAYFISAGNTIGLGADGLYQRNVLDGATLNRFSKVIVDYDLDVERAMMLSTGCAASVVDRITANVAAARQVMNDQSLNIILSPRDSRAVAAAVTFGDTWEDAWDIEFLNGLDKDTRTKMAPLVTA